MRGEHGERLVVARAGGGLRRTGQEAEVGALLGFDHAVDRTRLAEVLLTEVCDQWSNVTRGEDRLPWLPQAPSRRR
jgi:hypothetical protein